MRLLTSVNDLAAIEVSQAVQHAFGALSQHLLTGSATQFLDFAVDRVETAAFAELHSNGDGAGRLVHECSVVLANMRRCAILVEFQLS